MAVANNAATTIPTKNFFAVFIVVTIVIIIKLITFGYYAF
jgi:hypothetical protein